MARFGQKEKLAHYTGIAKGEIPTKESSKYSKKEQEAYARGQRDARNEANRIYAYNKATPEQRADYASKQAWRRSLWKSQNFKKD